MRKKDLILLADATPSYRVDTLYDPQGRVAPHFQDEISAYGESFDHLMLDPIFAQIIERELEGESIANVSLAALSDLAPSDRVRDLYLEWLGFINSCLQPWTTGGAIHFRPHWARVLMLALVLGEARRLPEADLRALAMASVFHDSRRKNPYMDTGHGDRAAEYYVEFCEGVVAGEKREAPDENAIRFDERTYLTIKWHDRDDEDGIAAMRKSGKERAEEIYLLFKDADGLDRVRLGEGEPDVRYLRTKEALDLLPFARELLRASLELA